jgi:hypothetical protein
MPRWAAKVDGNHAEIVELFQVLGWSVLSLARVGQGVPDLLIAKQGRTVLVEVKMRLGRLQPLQELFLSWWQGETAIVRSLEDVQALNRSGQAPAPAHGDGQVPERRA